MFPKRIHLETTLEPLPSFHSPYWTDLKAAAAVQAMFLLDDNWLPGNIDAFLRAFGVAQFTADALVRYKVSADFIGSIAKSERGPFNRASGKIEPLPGSLIDLKNC